jgi:TPP-dependent pyruvate/acetoin dehydrogenase alpha subunit
MAMTIDLWRLYESMLKSRLFEEAVSRIWHEGRISGEMHLSIGEEAITAGTVLQLVDGDAMALDHRGTAALVMRGAEPALLLKEFMGLPDGLCAGMGGHMHLFAPEMLAASSGIVGASGPAAAGFALAAKVLRPGTAALAFFGDGAMNQGMLLESMNLAAAWTLPVVFVCKDSGWAITTVSASVTGGRLTDRAHGLGLAAEKIDGTDVEVVWKAAGKALEHARAGRGPSFIHATCRHPEGHFLGDPLVRITRHPVREMKKVAGPMLRSATRRKGASLTQRSGGLGRVTSLLRRTATEGLLGPKDPLAVARARLKYQKPVLEQLENRVAESVRRTVEKVAGPTTAEQA